MNRIGIIGAMDVEVDQLKKDMTGLTVVKKGGREFYLGQLCGQEAAVVRCGIGKINAASCAQILIDCMDVSCLINTGIAGSLDAQIDIGDLVISTDAVHHDLDVSIFGYARGQVPQVDTLGFPADEKLADLAVRVCKEIHPDIHVFRGRVASGDQFIESNEAKAFIRDTFGALCTEMEGAAIAHTAYLNDVPYLIVRAISDKADDSATMAYNEFEAEAARRSYQLIEGMLAQM